jgi:hypothetical protein
MTEVSSTNQLDPAGVVSSSVVPANFDAQMQTKLAKPESKPHHSDFHLPQDNPRLSALIEVAL